MQNYILLVILSCLVIFLVYKMFIEKQEDFSLPDHFASFHKNLYLQDGLKTLEISVTRFVLGPHGQWLITTEWPECGNDINLTSELRSAVLDAKLEQGAIPSYEGLDNAKYEWKVTNTWKT